MSAINEGQGARVCSKYTRELVYFLKLAVLNGMIGCVVNPVVMVVVYSFALEIQRCRWFVDAADIPARRLVG